MTFVTKLVIKGILTKKVLIELEIITNPIKIFYSLILFFHYVKYNSLYRALKSQHFQNSSILAFALGAPCFF